MLFQGPCCLLFQGLEDTQLAQYRPLTGMHGVKALTLNPSRSISFHFYVLNGVPTMLPPRGARK